MKEITLFLLQLVYREFSRCQGHTSCHYNIIMSMCRGSFTFKCKLLKISYLYMSLLKLNFGGWVSVHKIIFTAHTRQYNGNVTFAVSRKQKCRRIQNILESVFNVTRHVYKL